MALMAGAAGALPAQQARSGRITLAVGLIGAPPYGVTRTVGGTIGAGVRQAASSHITLRFDVEYQWLGARDGWQLVGPPCNVSLQPCPMWEQPTPGGRVEAGNLLVGVEWRELPARGGAYLLAGLGPQYLFEHPQERGTVQIVAQVGAGIAVPIGSAALELEARYERRLGAGILPTNVVPVTLGLRL